MPSFCAFGISRRPRLQCAIPYLIGGKSSQEWRLWLVGFGDPTASLQLPHWRRGLHQHKWGEWYRKSTVYATFSTNSLKSHFGTRCPNITVQRIHYAAKIMLLRGASYCGQEFKLLRMTARMRRRAVRARLMGRAARKRARWGAVGMRRERAWTRLLNDWNASTSCVQTQSWNENLDWALTCN